MTQPTEGGELAPGALNVLRATPAVIAAIFRGQPNDVLERPGEEDWSPKDVLAHLASIQGPALVERVKAMVENDLPQLVSVDEHENLERFGLCDRPADELLKKYAAERAEAMAFLERLGPAETRRRGRFPVAGEITVADAVHHMAYHDLLHVGQIAALLAEPIRRSRGGLGRAFPV